MISIGLKILLGLFLFFFLFNLLYQYLFEEKSTWKVRQMKNLLSALEPKQEMETMEPYSFSPYTKTLREWTGQGEWIGEIARNSSNDLNSLFQTLFMIFKQPLIWIEKITRIIDWFGNTVHYGMSRIYKELGHHMNILV